MIRDHENRMLLLDSRQKNYEFLLNGQKQLSEDEHFAIEEVCICLCASLNSTRIFTVFSEF